MPHTLISSRWRVDEYHWVKAVPWERTEGRPWTDEEASWVLTKTPDGSQTRVYNPLQEHPGLFKTFAGTSPTREGVARFASRYGMLGLRSPHTTEWEFGSQQISGEALDQWRWHIEVVKLTLVVQTALQAGDIMTLRQVYEAWLDLRVFCYLDGNVSLHPDDFPTGPQPDIWWTDPRCEVDIVEVRYSLGDILTAALKGHLSPKIVPTESASFDLFMVPDSLVSAMWYQVTQLVVGHKEFRCCARSGCDAWIEISLGLTGSRSSKRYCTDGCRMKAYRMRQEQARELKRQGMSLREIAHALGSDTHTVRSWLAARQVP